MRKIGIIGSHGIVGGALRRYFEKKSNYEIFCYDKGKNIGSMDEVNKADYIYIAVPTPTTEEGCDISIINEVMSRIEDGKVIIIKSTVIPGTTKLLQLKYPKLKILFNPEFLTELTADQDTEFPDRQIIGYTKESYNVAQDVILQLPLASYERIIRATEAEMIKYFTNCWFALKVVYANQMYDICKAAKIDYSTVMSGSAADKRIGRTHLKIWHKGYRGYGGKCLPKDTTAIIKFAKKLKVDVPLLETLEKINKTLICQKL